MIRAEGEDKGYSRPVEFNPNTGIAPDGTIGPTQREHELAGEWLKLQEQIRTMEGELHTAHKDANAKDSVRPIQLNLRAAYNKLGEIERQEREEQKRKNRLNGWE